MTNWELSQSAELNSDPGDPDPSFGARLGGLVLAHQSAMVHQPAQGPLHHPTIWQDPKAFRIIGTLDHLHVQFGAQALDPVREGLAGVPAIHPQNAQPSKPAQHACQEQLSAVTFGGGIGTRDGYAQDQSNGPTSRCRLRL